MGKCVLSFDEIGLIVQKSDDRHADNDWMTVIWMVTGRLTRVDTFPLAKINGDLVLHHGDVIAPFSLEIPCTDPDVVHAIFVIFNAGSYDWSDQRDVVTKQANKMSDVIIDAYTGILDKYVEETGLADASDIFKDGIDYFRKGMKWYMEEVFSHSILQLIDDIMDEVADLLGPPQCNGLVLNDDVLFLPGEPFPDLTIVKTITSPEQLDGCGDAAKTSLQITMHRDLEVPMQFANAPPPAVDTVPATGQSLQAWVGTWCEDSTPTPRVVVTVGDVRRAPISHTELADVTIREDVDLRYGARFTAAASGVSAEQAHVAPFAGPVFGSIKPLAMHPVSPGDLKVVQVPHLAAQAAAPDGENAANADVPPRPPITKAIFKLDYTRTNSGGTPIRSRPVITAGAAAAGAGSFLESVEAIDLRDRGVMLALYEFRSSGSVIGHGVRYMRAEDVMYARADLMLVRWTPAG